MNANQVRAIVTAQWPAAMTSPLAVAFTESAAAQEASRAVDFANLQATASEKQLLRNAAVEHAEACLQSCDGWEVETLAHNIESEFGHDLDLDECDDIARAALAKAKQA